MRRDYPALDMSTAGLASVEVSVWRGFVFVRLEDDGGPSVAAMMAPYDHEIAPIVSRTCAASATSARASGR